MQNYFNKTRFFNEVNGFYRRIKLKAHFKDQTNKLKTEEEIFRKPTDKTWIPTPPPPPPPPQKKNKKTKTKKTKQNKKKQKVTTTYY